MKSHNPVSLCFREMDTAKRCVVSFPYNGLFSSLTINYMIKSSARQKICKMSEDIFALIHELLDISMRKSVFSFQLLTLLINATDTINKEFQRTYNNFQCPEVLKYISFLPFSSCFSLFFIILRCL